MTSPGSAVLTFSEAWSEKFGPKVGRPPLVRFAQPRNLHIDEPQPAAPL